MSPSLDSPSPTSLAITRLDIESRWQDYRGDGRSQVIAFRYVAAKAAYVTDQGLWCDWALHAHGRQMTALGLYSPADPTDTPFWTIDDDFVSLKRQARELLRSPTAHLLVALLRSAGVLRLDVDGAALKNLPYADDEDC